MGFCHLQEDMVINMVKNWWILQQKTGIDAAKTASKRVVRGDLIGNKVTDKITPIGKPKKTKTKRKEK